jgi:hypothetical protein
MDRNIVLMNCVLETVVETLEAVLRDRSMQPLAALAIEWVR